MNPPTGTKDAAVTREMPPVAARDSAPLPPAPMIVGPVGEACTKCGAPVAADQRYCIECGERQGDPRLPFMDGRTAANPSVEVVQAPAFPAVPYPPAQPKGKWSSGIALLSTVAVLLLAMGVGVLIGDAGGEKASSQQPMIVGGVGATTAAGATGATAATDNKAAEASAAAADGDGTTEAGVDAEALAKKNGVKLAPKDVDLGEKCEKGSVGCSDEGTFDGDYFK